MLKLRSGIIFCFVWGFSNLFAADLGEQGEAENSLQLSDEEQRAENLRFLAACGSGSESKLFAVLNDGKCDLRSCLRVTTANPDDLLNSDGGAIGDGTGSCCDALSIAFLGTIRKGHHPKCMQLLIDKGVVLEGCGHASRMNLGKCLSTAMLGNISTTEQCKKIRTACEILLKAGFDPNEKVETLRRILKLPPAFIAASLGVSELPSLFVRYGADLHTCLDDGSAKIDLVRFCAHWDWHKSQGLLERELQTETDISHRITTKFPASLGIMAINDMTEGASSQRRQLSISCGDIVKCLMRETVLPRRVSACEQLLQTANDMNIDIQSSCDLAVRDALIRILCTYQHAERSRRWLSPSQIELYASEMRMLGTFMCCGKLDNAFFDRIEEEENWVINALNVVQPGVHRLCRGWTPDKHQFCTLGRSEIRNSVEVIMLIHSCRGETNVATLPFEVLFMIFDWLHIENLDEDSEMKERVWNGFIGGRNLMGCFLQ